MKILRPRLERTVDDLEVGRCLDVATVRFALPVAEELPDSSGSSVIAHRWGLVHRHWDQHRRGELQ